MVLEYIEAGGWFGDSLLTGERCSLIGTSHIVIGRLDDKASNRRIELPETGPGILGPRYLRMSNEPRRGFQMAGQSDGRPGTWLYRDGKWQLDPRISNGESAHIFDLQGELQIIEPAANQTSQGYRYIDENGQLILGDNTILLNEVSQWNRMGDTLIGQGRTRQGGVVAVRGADRRLLRPGPASFIRVRRLGDAFSLAYVASGYTCFLWFTASDLTTFQPELLDAPVIIIPPPVETRMYRSQDQVFPYIQRRWAELGVPQKVEAVKAETGIPTDRDMTDLRIAGENGNSAAKAKHDDAEAKFRAAQVPYFFQAISELYWLQGMHDIGLGRKTSGTNWEGKATDIIVMKPMLASGAIVDGQVQQIDAVSGNGYPEAHPSWGVIDFNPDRTWVEPPAVSGGVPVPSTTHRYDGGGNDTGTCDTCGQSRFHAVHATPQSKVAHVYDGGEQDTGLCDICQLGPNDPRHRGGGPVPPPVDPPKPPGPGAVNLKPLWDRIGKLEYHQKRIDEKLTELLNKPPKMPTALDGSPLEAEINALKSRLDNAYIQVPLYGKVKVNL